MPAAGGGCGAAAGSSVQVQSLILTFFCKQFSSQQVRLLPGETPRIEVKDS